MTSHALLQNGVFLLLLLVLAWPLGAWIARVHGAEGAPAGRALAALERATYRLCGIDPTHGMTWAEYARAMLGFNLAGALLLYGAQRMQALLPGNPLGVAAVTPDSAYDTAVSFVTNTDWQGYAGESAMSLGVQMGALTVQNFASAATGMALLLPLVRAFRRERASDLGNFWVDLTRSTLYVLLPLALLLAMALVSQGVVQTFTAGRTVPLMEAVHYDIPRLDAAGQPVLDAAGRAVTDRALQATQTIALGLVASQVAIKQLGTNGGGFFNANSAHPLENPTALSNLLELLAILLIPAALCHTFGRMVGDPRQGRVMLAAMLIIFVPLCLACIAAEQAGNPALASLGVDQSPGPGQPGGNMEGKEARFGIVGSALWATATTAASNGSVNAMHDSFTPLGGLVPMWLMQLGEVIFGGVGSGLYGMLLFALIAVFVGGLMIGRTPEYLGKKIEAHEIRMTAIAVLLPLLVALGGTALAVATEAGRAGLANPGAHGLSEALYAFSSAGNNNGSAFAGLNANTPFYNAALGIAMMVGRYGVAIPVLAIAGSLAAKGRVPAGLGTLPTHTPLFAGLLAGIVIVLGALTFIPALALGPLAEHLMLHGAR